MPRDLSLPVRYSHVRMCGKQSPAHFFHSSDDDNDSATLERGRAVHAIALRNRKVIPVPKGMRRDPRAKKWQEFIAANEGADILPAAAYETANAMAAAILMHPMASQLLSAGVPEETFLWEQGGITCRGTPDLYSTGSLGFVADIKTTRSSCPDDWAFPRQAQQMGWPAQLVWYGDGLRAAKKADPFHYYLIACEATVPHIVTVFRLTDRAIDAARAQNAKWFAAYKQCRDSWDKRQPNDPPSMHWPPYTNAVAELDVLELPSFADFPDPEPDASEQDAAAMEEAA